MSETLFESDTMYDDYVADERDHISGDATPADGTTFEREDGSRGVWINGLPRTTDDAPVAHYHVISGIAGGYMPSSNYYASDLDTASALLDELREDFIDRAADDTNARTVHGTAADGYVTYVDDDDPYDLGEYAEVVPCREDCDPEAEYN